MSALYIDADYVAALVAHGETNGIPATELLQTASMPSVLAGLVPWAVVASAIGLLARKKGEDCSGLEFGLTLGITNHGLLGYAARSARTALDAILLDEKYLATRTNVMHFRIVSHPEKLALHIDSTLSQSDPGWRFVHLAALGSIARMYADLFNGRCLDATFIVPFPADTLQKIRHPLLSGISWKEEPRSFRVEASPDLLLAVLPSGDETLKRLLVDQCEAAMPASSALKETVTMVRNLLRNQLVDPPQVRQLGCQLNLTERTLKRRLQEAGTSYRAILAELRVEAAVHYLQTTDLTVDEISSRLGYASPSTFKNLFRQWSGKTPGEFRKNR